MKEININATGIDGNALLYEDYLKLNRGKVGDIITLSDGISYKLKNDISDVIVNISMDELGTYIPYGVNDTFDNR